MEEKKEEQDFSPSQAAQLESHAHQESVQPLEGG